MYKNNNQVFKFIIPLSILGFGCKTATAEKPEIKPNIVLILSDDQGWGDLSINGNSNLSTPNIDRLAKTGVTFNHFYVCAVCSPTRAELLTGRYHERGGVYDTSSGGERLDLDETTIAQVFKSNGYKTAAYGKWHSGMQPPYHPNARGFDDYYGFCSGHWGNYFNPVLEHNGKIVKGKGFIIDDLTDHGIRFIEDNKEQPFFLYLPFNSPHSPMQVPDRWWKKFENKELKQLHDKPENEDIQFTRAALAMCENIDWNVGRILQRINELGLSKNTIILYFSDNGPNSNRWNGGMKGKKGSVDEGGVRSPLIMKWEGKLKAGQNVNRIAGAIDLLPTLTDLAGIKCNTQKPLDGVSLIPLLMEENSVWNERVLINHWGKNISVRSQRYRLDAANKLYDMEKDLAQTVDISKKQPEITKQLILDKEKWKKDVLAELPDHDLRTFPIGHPEYSFTQIPARDAVAHGNIKRSNFYPNCSYLYNWTGLEDKITWEAEVLTEGDYEVELWYSCPAKEVGSEFELSFNEDKLVNKIIEAHDPPVIGMENDRFPRIESYIKEFKPIKIGIIHLKKGKGTLKLQAKDIRGSQVMDFSLLMFTRKEN